jgi:hypothetical protein
MLEAAQSDAPPHMRLTAWTTCDAEGCTLQQTRPYRVRFAAFECGVAGCTFQSGPLSGKETPLYLCEVHAHEPATLVLKKPTRTDPSKPLDSRCVVHTCRALCKHQWKDKGGACVIGRNVFEQCQLCGAERSTGPSPADMDYMRRHSGYHPYSRPC